VKFSGFFAGALLGALLLAACGGNHGFSLPASAVAPARPSSAGSANNEKILYRFGGRKDGENPESSLVDVGGTLYGVTIHGGSTTCAALNSPPGCGTIFRINTSGSGYSVLHRYPKSALEGSQPVAGVIDAGGRSTAQPRSATATMRAWTTAGAERSLKWIRPEKDM
jgi:uncharacterized repeat protein (TIGR03803 family)